MLLGATKQALLPPPCLGTCLAFLSRGEVSTCFSLADSRRTPAYPRVQQALSTVWCRERKKKLHAETRTTPDLNLSGIRALSSLELQSRFGDKPIRFEVVLYPKRDCSPKRDTTTTVDRRGDRIKPAYYNLRV